MERLLSQHHLPRLEYLRRKEAVECVLIQHFQSEGLIVPLKVVRWTRNRSASPTSHSRSCLSESCNSRRGHLHHFGFSCEEQQEQGAEFSLICESQTGLVLKPHSATPHLSSSHSPHSSTRSKGLLHKPIPVSQ